MQQCASGPHACSLGGTSLKDWASRKLLACLALLSRTSSPTGLHVSCVLLSVSLPCQREQRLGCTGKGPNHLHHFIRPPAPHQKSPTVPESKSLPASCYRGRARGADTHEHTDGGAWYSNAQKTACCTGPRQAYSSVQCAQSAHRLGQAEE